MPQKKILLVDDEQTVIYSIEKALKQLPYKIHSALNGQDALNILENLTPDLIILDLSMPQMNGIEFLKAINLKPNDPYAVIILTGHGDDEELQQCYQLGAHFFFRKPFGMTDLTCLVERCITFKDLERESLEHRRNLEESVESQNTYINKLSLALDQSSTSIIMSDNRCKITYINSSYSKISGFTLQEIKGNHILFAFDSHNSLQLEDAKQHLEQNASWKGELLCVNKSGEKYWVALAISPIKNNEDIITNYLLIEDDITAQKEAELEKERSLELANSHIQTKRDFSNNISHEFLTPIHIISTATSFLKTKFSDESLIKYIEYVQKAVGDLTSLTTMILDMKRLESNLFSPTLTQVSLKNILIDITHIEMPKATAKNLKFSYFIDKNVPEQITSDEMFLTQILKYLVDNAIKFTETGQISISAKIDTAHNSLVIEITDTGIGIAETKLQIIFESFQQEDGSNSRSHNGMGLGLTLAQNLAEELGGNITVKSIKGKGSLFSLNLPLTFSD